MTQTQWIGPAESHPLDGPRGKLVRAAQHARHLSLHCEAYEEQHPAMVRVRFDGDTGAHLLFLEGHKPPLYLGLILGEVVHDLRSTLDQLAWALALDEVGPEPLSEPRVGNAIQFPISGTRSDFDAHRAIKYFNAAAVALMESFQPYHNLGLQLVNPLALVQRLSNTDKHRGLTPSLGQIRLGEFVLRSPELLPYDRVETLLPEGAILDPTMPVMRIDVSEDTKVEFDSVRTHVCFGTDVTGRRDVIFPDKIQDLCERIAEVVSPFEALFPAVDWSERRESWITPDLSASGI